LKALVTGATGFVGALVATQLRARGDDVVALVRSPAAATRLEAQGCEIVAGDLRDQAAVRRAVDGCDAALHLAGVYKVGIPAAQRSAMYEANVGGTERVLGAAVDAGVERIVHVSTLNAFGNTRGEVVDETYERAPGAFLSCYDESKYLAHRHAQELIAKGAPVMIAQLGAVYGPGDHSEIGGQIERARAGRLPFKVFPEVGLNLVHVEDAAKGILLVHERGRLGESYVLGGEIARLGDVIDRVARMAHRRPPRLTIPAGAVSALAPLGPVLGERLGFPPDLREVVRTSRNVTFWATDAKARAELGYEPRGLDEGLRDTFATSSG
jgi:dihydroflavonol-4-reductase